MSDTVAVIVASYGDKEFWDSMAVRAINSAYSQSRQPDEVLRIHGNSLHQARNEGAVRAKTDYLCFLDCDDELEPGYLEAMMVPTVSPIELRYPRVRYISESLVDMNFVPEPVILPRRSIDRGNFMVIGTLVDRGTFMTSGGFRDLQAYEDWDLWIRCWMLGAEPRLIRDAVYRAIRRRGSRNTIKNAMGISAEILQYNKYWQKEMKRKGVI